MYVSFEVKYEIVTSYNFFFFFKSIGIILILVLKYVNL